MRAPAGRLAILVLTAMAAPGGSMAGDTPPVFPARLEQVHITVTVQDAGGRLVPNLSSQDFQVFENGRPQKIALFGRAVEPREAEHLALDLGLLMDTSSSMIQELKFSQQAAVRFLESIPRARDLYTIFFDDDIRISHYDSENQQGLFERILKSQ